MSYDPENAPEINVNESALVGDVLCVTGSVDNTNWEITVYLAEGEWDVAVSGAEYDDVWADRVTEIALDQVDPALLCDKYQEQRGS